MICVTGDKRHKRKKSELVPHAPNYTSEDNTPNPNWEKERREAKKRKEVLTAVFDLPIWANESVVVREFAICVLQAESAGTRIDETLIKARQRRVTR